MKQDILLGAFEELVLLAVAHLGGQAYGMQVRREIERRSGREVAIGAVYATLDRMQQKGYLESQLLPAGKERRGRPRKFFSLQPPGVQVLRQARRLHDRMWSGVDMAALDGKGDAPQ